MALKVQTAYGAKTVAAVQPGKTSSHAFTTRLPNIEGGTVTVTASATVDGEPVTSETDAAYPAQVCG